MSGSGILMLFLVSSIIFLLMGLSLVLFIMQYQKKTIIQSEELENSKVNHQKQMLDATIQSQEAERRRIASNLHDSLGAQLSTVRLFMLMQGEEKKELKAFADESAEMLLESIQEVREIAQDLLPSALKYGGLVSASTQFFNSIEKSTSIQLNAQVNGDIIRLSEKNELSVFRVIQELVNNTLKHAKASVIDVDLNFQDSKLLVTYKDNGVGLQNNVNNEGLGLFNIESRIQSLKGEYSVNSNPGKGVEFAIEIPLTTDIISN
jgi:signal transduction histidine kinase